VAPSARFAGLLAWLVVAAACGDDVIPAPPVPLEELGAGAREAVCDWAVRCRHVPDQATCERLLDPKEYDVRRALDAVAAGRLEYDPVLGGACVAANREQSCQAPEWSSSACRNMFRGVVAEGGVCTSRFECQGHGDCEPRECSAQCCLGTCGPAMPLFEPDLRLPGDSCTSHFECEPGTYCEENRRCTPLPTEEGQRCLFGCALGDLYCDLDALVCRRYAGAGEACDRAGIAAPPCDAAWSYCRGGICVPRPGPDEPCDGEEAVCIATTFCADGQCRARGTEGAGCSDGSECDVACDTEAGQCVGYQTCATP